MKLTIQQDGPDWIIRPDKIGETRPVGFELADVAVVGTADALAKFVLRWALAQVETGGAKA